MLCHSSSSSNYVSYTWNVPLILLIGRRKIIFYVSTWKCIYICFNIVKIIITIRKKQVVDRQNIYEAKKKFINDNNKKEGRLNVCIYSHLFSFLSYYDDSHTWYKWTFYRMDMYNFCTDAAHNEGAQPCFQYLLVLCIYNIRELNARIGFTKGLYYNNNNNNKQRKVKQQPI